MTNLKDNLPEIGMKYEKKEEVGWYKYVSHQQPYYYKSDMIK